MLKMLLLWLINAASLLLVARLVPGIVIEGLIRAMAGSVGARLVNVMLRPLMQLLALPITLLTFGAVCTGDQRSVLLAGGQHAGRVFRPAVSGPPSGRAGIQRRFRAFSTFIVRRAPLIVGAPPVQQTNSRPEPAGSGKTDN